MSRRLSLLVAAVAFVLVASPASAQATRTWVSGVGDDVNPCSRTAPCKTFAGAISKTAAGGEISVLDPGGYGTLTITKSITLSGVGENASIVAPSTSGIVINTPGITVTIRGIQINGIGNGLVGIRLRQNSRLIIEDSTIEGFQYAVHVDEGTAVVSRSSVLTSGYVGVGASGGTLTVDRTLIAGNGVGVQATAAGTVRLSDNHIVNNTISVACGGLVVSAGNNTIVGGLAPCAPVPGVPVQ